jgi:hypothetical protein
MTTQKLTERIWNALPEPLTRERHNKTIDLFVGSAKITLGVAVVAAGLITYCITLDKVMRNSPALHPYKAITYDSDKNGDRVIDKTEEESLRKEIDGAVDTYNRDGGKWK